MHSYRPTYKRPANYYTTLPRPSSPVQPTFEPLSPPRPIEPTFNYPALDRQQQWTFSQQAPHSVQHAAAQNPSRGEHTDPYGLQTPATGAHTHGQKRKHQRTPSTIDELADAALATSPTYTNYSRKSSFANGQDRILPPPVFGHRQASPQGPGNYFEDVKRAAKRARSEVGPSPATHPFASRPSTSYVPAHEFSYNVEQGIDRARRQSTNTQYSNVEDAELLLNFAGRVAPRPPRVPSPIHEAPVLAPSALPALDETTKAPLPASMEERVAAPTTLPLAVSAVESFPTPVQQEDPSVSLPSPQDTNEDDGKSSKSRQESVPFNQTASAPEPVPEDMLALQQIQTPPEDDKAPKLVTDADIVMVDAPVTETTTIATEATEPTDISKSGTTDTDAVTEEEAPKKSRRGWPKGKPRGPRKSSSTVKSRPRRQRTAGSSAKSEAGSALESDQSDEGDFSATQRRASFPAYSDSSYAALQERIKSTERRREGSVPPNVRMVVLPPQSKTSAPRKSASKANQETVCAQCNTSRESATGELDQWISCNGCKQWFHSDCAGFQNEREIRDVDKYFCTSCEPKYGATTYVRKSARAHAAVDYAGLNQGVLKTSDDNVEHHYIQPIKDGTFTFDPETFPRMRPELVTKEYFETSASFSEPVLVPAEFNPRPGVWQAESEPSGGADEGFASAQEESWMVEDYEYEVAPNDGQDRLDMVIPRGLTVRQVCHLVGPDEPLEVIDVKTQGTEGKHWNLAKWTDYYEAEGEKTVRNVISLEVSSTKLGRLLRRPKVVRQIDLQDSVWPAEETAKGNYPKVQFYCLMSVADSYTDFHIDFGGSSVYYHILRGSKTFFFIPPKPKHLKAYEDWNNSPEQNYTFLPNITKECYRVDLSEGDTMLIPSGWIHAVWTPSNSLVIGGNFLTRMHYPMQFRIVEIEKATKVSMKFRYPHFQKVMWYAVIKYLETDPLPREVEDLFLNGSKFHRERPIWHKFRRHGVTSDGGPEAYNARYYSQAELDGLPDLINFIFRTVMISLGRIEGVSEDTRKKVVRSIPKSHGEPLDVARKFALWVAWKRGNEDPPAWAHPDAVLPNNKEGGQAKKLSAKALKELQRQEAIEAWKIAGPDRVSARQQAAKAAEASVKASASPAPSVNPRAVSPSAPLNQYTSTPKTSVLGPKRVACDACRKRRIRCKHKDVVTTAGMPGAAAPAMLPKEMSFNSAESGDFGVQLSTSRVQLGPLYDGAQDRTRMEAAAPPPAAQTGMVQAASSDAHGPALVPGSALLAESSNKRGRSKACFECRKSKRRCIHDEYGKVDPVKAAEAPVPRGTATKKRKSTGDVEGMQALPNKKPNNQRQSLPVVSQSQYAPDGSGGPQSEAANAYSEPSQLAPSYQPNMMPSYTENWQMASYAYPDPTENDNIVVAGPYHGNTATVSDNQVPYNTSLQQFASEVLESYPDDETVSAQQYPDPTAVAAFGNGNPPYSQHAQDEGGLLNGEGNGDGQPRTPPNAKPQESADSGIALDVRHAVEGMRQEMADG